MNQPRIATLLFALVVLSTTMMSSAWAAEAYRFEMVIFERPGGTGGGEQWPDQQEPPDNSKAVGSLDALSVGSRALGPVAYTLNKRGLPVLEHLAWRQVPRGRGSEAWYTVGSGRLSGLVRITRGRYLHFDADLYLRDPGSANVRRVHLYRRMRSDELHYVDHPLLGIVIRADRLQPRSEPDSADAAAGEPKPVQPSGDE